MIPKHVIGCVEGHDKIYTNVFELSGISENCIELGNIDEILIRSFIGWGRYAPI